MSGDPENVGGLIEAGNVFKKTSYRNGGKTIGDSKVRVVAVAGNDSTEAMAVVFQRLEDGETRWLLYGTFRDCYSPVDNLSDAEIERLIELKHDTTHVASA